MNIYYGVGSKYKFEESFARRNCPLFYYILSIQDMRNAICVRIRDIPRRLEETLSEYQRHTRSEYL